MRRCKPFSILALAFILAAVACLFIAVPSAQACPNCSAAVADTGGLDWNGGTGADGEVVAAGPSLAAGFNYSIVFMLAVPYTLAAGFGGAFYWHMKKRSVALAAAASGDV